MNDKTPLTNDQIDAAISALESQRPVPPAEPDPRLTWKGIKNRVGDMLQIKPAPVPGYVYIGAGHHSGVILVVRANAADLGQLCLAAWQARMNLKGFEAAERSNSLWEDTLCDNQAIERALMNMTAIGEKS